MTVARIAAAVLLAYLLGAVPFSLIIGKRFYSVDLREHGSGNLGATNVFRTLGARAAIMALVLDALKGAAAVLIAGLLTDPLHAASSVMGPTGAATAVAVQEWTRLAAMFAAVLGHSYSPYIKFRGGKGVATSAGALAVLTPMAFVIELCLFMGVVASTRIVSLGSVLVAITYPMLVLWLYPGDTPILVVIIILASLVVWRHRSNIVRIVRGQENRLSFSKRGAAREESED